MLAYSHDKRRTQLHINSLNRMHSIEHNKNILRTLSNQKWPAEFQE